MSEEQLSYLTFINSRDFTNKLEIEQVRYVPITSSTTFAADVGRQTRWCSLADDVLWIMTVLEEEALAKK